MSYMYIHIYIQTYTYKDIYTYVCYICIYDIKRAHKYVQPSSNVVGTSKGQGTPVWQSRVGSLVSPSGTVRNREERKNAYSTYIPSSTSSSSNCRESEPPMLR